jgi:branched-chain amino acid transport system substrate-binding protein
MAPSKPRRSRIRRRTASAAVLISAALAMAACGSSKPAAKSSSTTAAAKAKAAVKIGFVVPTTGPFAQIGDDMVDGAKLAASQVNAKGGMDGHPVQIVVENGKTSTTTTVADVRSLASSGVDLFGGFIIDSTCLAAVPVLKSLGDMGIGTSCQSNLVHTTDFYKRFFNISPTNYMLAEATAVFAKQQYPNVTTWKGAMPDYSFGHEVWNDFRADLKKLQPSASFDKGVFIPLTETRFGPYVTSILSGLPSDSSKTTGFFFSTFGSQTVGLVEAAKPVDMFGHFRVAINLGGSTPTAATLKTSTPKVWFVYDYDNLAYHNSVNTTFVKTFEAKYHGVPDAWSEEGYSVILAYQAAAAKAKSVSPAALAKALPGLSFDTPKGPLVFRPEDYVPITPVTVWQVEADPSSAAGFKITKAIAIPAKEILPPVTKH